MEESWVWTCVESPDVNATVDDDAIDLELIDLVIQLCTRIGMIMEDVSPLTLNASREGLEACGVEVARAIRTMATLAAALEVLLQG